MGQIKYSENNCGQFIFSFEAPLKLLIGGSPCTHWSIAQKNGRETEPKGLGWELFKNFLIALRKYKPDYFLYENNKSMSDAIKEQITRELGVEPILINSSLVSAQNRQRYYWTNIPGVKQPEDLGILLRDILESGEIEREKSYTLDAHYANLEYKTWYKRRYSENKNKQQHDYVFEPVPFGGIKDGKAYCLTANYAGAIPENTLERKQRTMVAEPIRIGTIENDSKNKAHDSKQYRVYSPHGKSTTICGRGGGRGAKTGLYAIPVDNPNKLYPVYEVKDGQITINDKQYPIKLPDGYYIIRKLTVLECKRLQTVPDDYIFPVSNTQAYRQLGNGWTVDIISHILSYIPGIKNKPVEVLSMYDGMSCGHIALDKLGINVTKYYATEIDGYAIQTTMANYPDTIQLGDAFQVRDERWQL